MPAFTSTSAHSTVAAPKPKNAKSMKASSTATKSTSIATTLTDRSAESQAIEKELGSRYLGTVCIFQDQVTTYWPQEGLVSNRVVDSLAVKKLAEVFAENMDRGNPRHHMVVTIPESEVDNFFDSLGVTKEELMEKSSKSNWPLVTKGAWRKYNSNALVLQGGQHRFAALKRCVTDPDQRWWPAKVYIEPISLNALDRIRANVKEVQTSLCDGERIVHMATYQSKIEEITNKADGVTKEKDDQKVQDIRDAMQWKVNEFDKSSIPRVKQLWDRPNLRKAVTAACDIPGLRQTFSVVSLSDILSLRIMDV
jgi:hypothetical protein